MGKELCSCLERNKMNDEDFDFDFFDEVLGG